MNAHTTFPASYTERQLDAFALAKTWYHGADARAELAKLDAPIAAYKATRSNEAWDAVCDAISNIAPTLETIREQTLFDLCSDDGHYDALDEVAIGGEEAAGVYEDALVFGEAELRAAA